MVAWNIWKQRNNALWSDSHIDFKTTVHKSLDFLYDWSTVNGRVSAHPPAVNHQCSCLHWHPPPPLVVKCDIDAAFFEQQNMTGLGVIIRDEVGAFIACRTSLIPGLVRVHEGEALGLCEALSWIKGLGIEKAVFEVDAKRVFDAIKSTLADFSEFGSIISCCRRFLDNNKAFSIKHAGRNTNSAAHAIGKAAICFPSPRVWVEPPDFVDGHLLNSCSCPCVF